MFLHKVWGRTIRTEQYSNSFNLKDNYIIQERKQIRHLYDN